MFTRKRIFFFCCFVIVLRVTKSAWLACWPSVVFFYERFANSFSAQDQTIIKIACIAIKFIWSFNVLKWKSFSDKNSNTMRKKKYPIITELCYWKFTRVPLNWMWYFQTAIIIGTKTMTFSRHQTWKKIPFSHCAETIL